jgi:hypothetical protein
MRTESKRPKPSDTQQRAWHYIANETTPFQRTQKRRTRPLGYAEVTFGATLKLRSCRRCDEAILVWDPCEPCQAIVSKVAPDVNAAGADLGPF